MEYLHYTTQFDKSSATPPKLSHGVFDSPSPSPMPANFPLTCFHNPSVDITHVQTQLSNPGLLELSEHILGRASYLRNHLPTA